MGVTLTDGRESKAMNSSEESDFLQGKWSMWEKESWQLQPGVGPLGLRREPGKTTQGSCSWLRSIKCRQCNRYDDGYFHTHHLIVHIKADLFSQRVNMLLTLLLQRTQTKAQSTVKTTQLESHPWLPPPILLFFHPAKGLPHPSATKTEVHHDHPKPMRKVKLCSSSST